MLGRLLIVLAILVPTAAVAGVPSLPVAVEIQTLSLTVESLGEYGVCGPGLAECPEPPGIMQELLSFYRTEDTITVSARSTVPDPLAGECIPTACVPNSIVVSESQTLFSYQNQRPFTQSYRITDEVEITRSRARLSDSPTYSLIAGPPLGCILKQTTWRYDVVLTVDRPFPGADQPTVIRVPFQSIYYHCERPL